jgi:hypothetical protein
MMMIKVCSSRLHFSHAWLSCDQTACAPFRQGRCFRGRERTDGTFSPRFRVCEMPRRSVAFMGTFELRCGANLCGFCLAWISDLRGSPALTNRSNPQHSWFPGIPFG